jgi:uncharacterized membrane protein YkvA (DUF1232 family)
VHGWLIALGLIAALYALVVMALALAGRRTAAKEIAALLPNFVILFKGLIRDPRVPRGSKWLLAFGAAWVASPIDLLPEFLPVLGPLDDAVVVALILRHLLKKAGEDVVREHWRGEPATMDLLLHRMSSRSGTSKSHPPEATG